MHGAVVVSDLPEEPVGGPQAYSPGFDNEIDPVEALPDDMRQLFADHTRARLEAQAKLLGDRHDAEVEALAKQADNLRAAVAEWKEAADVLEARVIERDAIIAGLRADVDPLTKSRDALAESSADWCRIAMERGRRLDALCDRAQKISEAFEKSEQPLEVEASLDVIERGITSLQHELTRQIQAANVIRTQLDLAAHGLKRVVLEIESRLTGLEQRLTLQASMPAAMKTPLARKASTTSKQKRAKK
jgi:chromosome segregation ATPase